MTDFPDSGNQGSVRLEDDLHNANNCGDHPHTQKKENFHSCNYSQRNGDTENRPQATMSDSFVPLVAEDSMVCQPTSSEQQSFNEQEISHLQESIRTEIPSEDENENNSPSDNKGTRGAVWGRAPFSSMWGSCVTTLHQNINRNLRLGGWSDQNHLFEPFPARGNLPDSPTLRHFAVCTFQLQLYINFDYQMRKCFRFSILINTTNVLMHLFFIIGTFPPLYQLSLQLGA